MTCPSVRPSSHPCPSPRTCEEGTPLLAGPVENADGTGQPAPYRAWKRHARKANGDAPTPEDTEHLVTSIYVALHLWEVSRQDWLEWYAPVLEEELETRSRETEWERAIGERPRLHWNFGCKEPGRETLPFEYRYDFTWGRSR